MTRITIVGAGTSAPQPDTPASGILVETASTAVLVDCGQGVVRSLMERRDPRRLDAIIIGHMHADHYIDIVSLRYLLPWDGFTGRRMPIHVPPGGRERVDRLAGAISERDGFFDHTFEVAEYDPAETIEIGDLRVDFIAGRHYVPAWGCRITDRAGHRIVISGDTGPSDALVDAARGADVFIAEATLLTAVEDDPSRGHLTAEEALDHGARAGAGVTVLVHHRPQNRAAIEETCRARDGCVVGVPGLTIELDGSNRVLGGDGGSSSAFAASDGGGDGVVGRAFGGDGQAVGPAGDGPAGIASRASRARRR